MKAVPGREGIATMSVTLRVEKEPSVVTFECTGRIGFDEVEQAYDAMFRHPDFHPGINALWDLRQASIGMYAQQIPDLLKMVSSRQKDRGRGYRVAILVAGSPDFGLSTLFELSTQTMPFTVRVFRSSTQATQWLAGQTV